MSRLLRFHKLNVPIYTSYLPSSTFVTLDSNSNNRRITSLQFTLQNTQSKRLLCTSCPNSEKKSKFKYLYTDKDGKQHENHDAKQVLSSKTYETLKSYQSEVDNTQDIKLAGATIPYNALKAAFLAEFCIFFVFGFFDNFIMMSVGENLDSHLSNLITHSMLAAAFGNWISDLFGLVTGERVEDFMNKHYPGPPLTHAQMLSKRYHNYKHAGRGIGISVGCLVGAIVAYPLLDFDEEEKDKENEKSENMTEEIAKQKTESS